MTATPQPGQGAQSDAIDFDFGALGPLPRERPRQVVILAGGRGTRLAPLTNHRPKPMIEFHGKPFLEYLIEMVREQGFTRVLLLLGYLPQPIMDYFGDGAKWGVQCSYSVSDEDHETGHRLKLALPRLDPVLLLMYCDNYWPMPFDRMWASYVAAGRAAQVTVYRNADQYSRDNLRVDGSGEIVTYDRSRKTAGLQGVDMGFLLLRREFVNALPDTNFSLEGVAYPYLIANHQLQAYVTEHRYYSVGDLARLPITAEFLKRQPTVLLDRDGVLNKRMPRAEYVTSWAEWEWLPGALEALRQLRQAGVRCLILSNQPGIARGMLNLEQLQSIHARLQADVERNGGAIERIYYCPHGWDESCECRKPKPGMLFQAQRDFGLDLSRAWYIGDDPRDEQAAHRAGCRFAHVSEERSLIDVVHEILPILKPVGSPHE